MPVKTKSEVIIDAIRRQIEIDDDLRAVGVRDLVGDYGELLGARALSVTREKPLTQGYDIKHSKYGRISVKTRKLPAFVNGKQRVEARAVGFKAEPPEQFDWLLHIVLNPDYSVSGACLAKYAEVWPEILRTTMKVSYKLSSTLPSSVAMTQEIANAASNLFADET